MDQRPFLSGDFRSPSWISQSAVKNAHTIAQEKWSFFHKSKTIPKSFMMFLKNKQLKQLASKTNLAVLKVVTPTRLDHTKYSIPLACPQIRRISPSFPSPWQGHLQCRNISRPASPLAWMIGIKVPIVFSNKKRQPHKKNKQTSLVFLVGVNQTI